MGARLEFDGDLATLALDEPESLNALDDALVADILAALDKIAGQPRLKALVLTGTGRAFSAGGRLSMLAGMAEEAADPVRREGLVRRMRTNARLVERLRELPLVTVAAVNGACVGAAIGWICACDLRIAARAAKFNTAFLSLGLGTDFGTAKLLSDTIGRGRAADWLLRPRAISAEEALAAGLVGEVVPDDQLLATAARWALSAGAFPAGARVMRENLAQASRSPLAACLDAEAVRFADSLAEPAVAGHVIRVAARESR
jgi:2-(1,2-epoxy-1,2-dihydrophenyl)acetyl-CoA isomerase